VDYHKHDQEILEKLAGRYAEIEILSGDNIVLSKIINNLDKSLNHQIIKWKPLG
jgi:hypothetical protein